MRVQWSNVNSLNLNIKYIIFNFFGSRNKGFLLFVNITFGFQLNKFNRISQLVICKYIESDKYRV